MHANAISRTFASAAFPNEAKIDGQFGASTTIPSGRAASSGRVGDLKPARGLLVGMALGLLAWMVIGGLVVAAIEIL